MCHCNQHKLIINALSWETEANHSTQR